MNGAGTLHLTKYPSYEGCILVWAKDTILLGMQSELG